MRFVFCFSVNDVVSGSSKFCTKISGYSFVISYVSESTASQNSFLAKNTLCLSLIAITAEEDTEGWKKEGYHSSEDMLLLKGPS